MKIAIQGTLGSYHHQAAINFFGREDISLLECMNFKNVTKSIHKKECEYGLIAIENSIAGSILPNYALITKYDLYIIGETYLPVQHHLMALQTSAFEDIEEIHSHPMALLQCDKFLEKYPHIKAIESADTATTAQNIQKLKLTKTAAIASELAAQFYDLKILKHNIQTVSENFTRFLVLKKQSESKDEFNKASVKFTVPHRSGSLVNILQEFVYLGINMEKIQSVPIIEKPWKYAFHVDFSFDDREQYEELKRRLVMKADEIKILGEYVKNNPYALSVV